MRFREHERSSSRRVAATTAVLGPSIALSEARTEGVVLFERRPPLHSVVFGRSRIVCDGVARTFHDAVAIPAGTRHRVEAIDGPFGCVAYLDARRFDFATTERLAERWRTFVPGRDDLRDAFGDALRSERRCVDRRLLRALDALEHDDATVEAAARRAGLSASRLTHAMTESLGPPPRRHRRWFKLQRALHQTLLAGADLTSAAHAAGFADSAHLSRTCRELMGVTPAAMLPPKLHLLDEE